MFSKALFFQSAKAHWVKWLTVTCATCVMLAIVIIVLGNLGINDIRDSLKNVFVQADQEATLKENAVDSYDLYITTANTNNQMDLFAMFGSSYINDLIADYDAEVLRQTEENGELTSAQKQQIAETCVTNLLENMKQDPTLSVIFQIVDEQELKMLLVNVLKAHDQDASLTGKTLLMEGYYLTVYDNAYALEIADGKTVEEATIKGNAAKALAKDIVSKLPEKKDDYSSDAANYVNEYMYTTVYNLQLGQGATKDDAKIYATSVKVISNTAISTYQLWQNEYNVDGEITDEELSLAKGEAIKSISDQIPQKVGEALTELGNMDMYGLIIGSIFYRIAGLLLPMVFVIMTANALLAGQVDSGSMAYVLSTPTKRRAVTVTQMTYLITAILAMFMLTTVTSVIAVWVVGGNNFAINYAEILLFNLGAFLTMFAFAGFCFMCSAIFNRTKYSLSIGGGLTIFSLVCTILGLFGSSVVPSAMRISAMDFFNYLSIITLFDTVSILDGGLSYLWKFGILLAIGVVTFIIGIFRFDKKDLPL